MKAIAYLIFITLLYSACVSKPDHPPPNQYGIFTFNEGSSHVYNSIDDFEDHEALYACYQETSCAQDIMVLTFEYKAISYELGLIPGCDIGQYYIRWRNVFEVKENEIYIDFNCYSFIDMDTLLYRQYHNNGKDPDFAEIPDKVVIFLDCNAQTFQNLEERLLSIFQAYDKAKVSVPLLVALKTEDSFKYH